MSVSDPEAWARLRLAQGESSVNTLELTSSMGPTSLTVGQNSGCDWLIRESGVAPVHFSLHWDGTALRIADIYNAGGVRLDGEPIGHQWRLVSGRVRIDFGKAAVVVETGAAAISDTRKDPTPLPPMHGDGMRRNVSNPPAASGSHSLRPSAKQTLLGVAPAEVLAMSAAARAAEPPSSAQTSERPHKATLLGLASVVTEPSPEAATKPPSLSPHSSIPAGTLMGIGMSPLAGSPGGSGFPTLVDREPAGSASALVAEDQGYGAAHARRAMASTQQEIASPFASQSSAAPAPSRGISTPSGAHPMSRTARIGSAWQEGVEERSAAVPIPRATLEESAPDPAFAPPHRSSQPRQLQPEPAGHFGAAPARGPRPAVPARPRSSGPFPWHYLGVGLLTVAAYFAWLYLLDHF